MAKVEKLGGVPTHGEIPRKINEIIDNLPSPSEDGGFGLVGFTVENGNLIMETLSPDLIDGSISTTGELILEFL